MYIIKVNTRDGRKPMQCSEGKIYTFADRQKASWVASMCGIEHCHNYKVTKLTER